MPKPGWAPCGPAFATQPPGWILWGILAERGGRQETPVSTGHQTPWVLLKASWDTLHILWTEASIALYFFLLLCCHPLSECSLSSLAGHWRSGDATERVLNLGIFFFFWLFRAAPMAYGGSQARGPIRAVAASHSHSHSHARSEPCLRPTSQLTAMPDP